MFSKFSSATAMLAAFACTVGTALAENAPNLPVGTRLAYEVTEANSVSDRIELQVIGAHGLWTIYLGDPGGHEFYYAETAFGLFSSDCLHPELPTDERIASTQQTIRDLEAADALDFTIDGTTQRVEVSEAFPFDPTSLETEPTSARTITVTHSENDTPIIYTADSETGIVYRAQWTEGYFDKLVELEPDDAAALEAYSAEDLQSVCPPVFTVRESTK